MHAGWNGFQNVLSSHRQAMHVLCIQIDAASQVTSITVHNVSQDYIYLELSTTNCNFINKVLNTKMVPGSELIAKLSRSGQACVRIKLIC